MTKHYGSLLSPVAGFAGGSAVLARWPARARLGTAERAGTAPTPFADSGSRMLREQPAPLRCWLASGGGAAATLQVTVVLLVATATPGFQPAPPAPVTLQIVIVPPPLTQVAEAGALSPSVAPPELAPADPVAQPPEPSQVQSLLTPPPDPGLAAPQILLADLPDKPALAAAPAAPTPPRRLAKLPELPHPTLRPVPRAVLRLLPAQPATAALTVTARAPASDAPSAAAGPPAAVPAAPSRAGLDSYEGGLKSAIQAALRYPPSAAMMGSDGRARVAFSICDARPANIHLVHGTGSPQLDAAALAAVRQAGYPRPPVEIGGRTMPMLVWVEFNRPDGDD